MAQSKKYFREGSFFFKSLRFLNLLEPEKPVLSLSKFMVILMMWLFVYVAIEHPENLAAVLGAGFGITASLANYGYRRHMQSRWGSPRLYDHYDGYNGPSSAEPPEVNPFGGIPSSASGQDDSDGLEPNPE